MTSPADSTEISRLQLLQASPELLAAAANCSAAERTSQKQLRARYPDDLVREALTVCDARQRAAGQLPSAEQLWLTRTGLEQATAWEVAVHKAARFAGCDAVGDLCCGIGSDAAALSLQTAVQGVDLSPAMVWRASQNAAVLGRPERFTGTVADVTTCDWSNQFIHADPDRRGSRSRPTRRLDDYCPNLTWLRHLLATARGGAIKLGPASDWPRHLGNEPGLEIELTSLRGECREATVWFGDRAGSEPRRATNLTTGTTLAGNPTAVARPVVDHVGDWLFEPDPAVIRAGLVDLLANQQGLARLAADEEYLTGGPVTDTGLLTPFRVEATLPANLKAVRRALRSQPRAAYEIKCRRLKVDVEAVRRQLPLGSGLPATLIFCRIGGQSRAVLASRK